MKIKTDFVTNSSTTVYLCYIPEGLIIDLEFLNKTGIYTDYSHGYDSPEELLEIAQRKLQEFKDGNQMDSWEDWAATSLVHQALNEHGCVIKDLDVGGGEGTYYVGISDKDIEKIKQLRGKEESNEDQIGLHHQ